VGLQVDTTAHVVDCVLCCGSHDQTQYQDGKLLQLSEQLVVLKESLNNTCLQNDVLQRDKDDLGMSLT